jgi:F1F0 ATPase subunit 2
MAMRELLLLAAASAAGLLLGAIFFGVSSQRPALWFLFSLLLRMSVALAGFNLVSGGRWDRLLACLLGFVVARLVVTRLSKPPLAKEEARYAP